VNEYVTPQFYLRGFLDPATDETGGPSVWVADLREGAVELRAPKNGGADRVDYPGVRPAYQDLGPPNPAKRFGENRLQIDHNSSERLPSTSMTTREQGYATDPRAGFEPLARLPPPDRRSGRLGVAARLHPRSPRSRGALTISSEMAPGGATSA
jgi:hypothetical protein